MNCLHCTSKACKTEARDCTGTRDETLSAYRDNELSQTFSNADSLVSAGRAGTLSRIEEIAEYCRLQGYDTIALAYCFSMEDLARQVSDWLQSEGFSLVSHRCTIQGIREKEINAELGSSVGCNPVGQAESINESKAQFVIEMGLCLGHDVIFHQHIKKPFTVLAVKDRVQNNIPQNFFLKNENSVS